MIALTSLDPSLPPYSPYSNEGNAPSFTASMFPGKATSCDRHQALLFGPACPGSSHTKRSRARHFHRLAFYRKTYLSSHRYNFVDGGT
ncbi:hypothetical protein V6N13_028096 [Hibiscus sabdariffa]